MLIVLEATGCISSHELPEKPLPVENKEYLGLIDEEFKKQLGSFDFSVYSSGIYIAKCSVKDLKKMAEANKSLTMREDIRNSPYYIFPFLIEKIDRV